MSRAAERINRRYMENLKRFRGQNCDALIRVYRGWFGFLLVSAVFLFEFPGVKARFIVARGEQVDIWAVMPFSSFPRHRIASLHRPEIEVVRIGMRMGTIRVDGTEYRMGVEQRPFLMQLMHLAGSLPTDGMAGCPAGWYHSPWAFPGLGDQLRYWDGHGWTEHVDPPTGTRSAEA